MKMRGRIVMALRNIQEDTNNAHLDSLKEHGFELHYVESGQDPLPVIQQVAPLATCFQYDHPELRGLAELRLVKERQPGVPLIMITRAHSESLAVWAFRTGVRDYFVQPVDLERFLAVLKQLREFRDSPDSRQLSSRPPLTVANAIPPEVRMRGTHASEGSATLELALSFVDRNLHRKILQTEVAEICGLSPFQFSRLFKRQYQVTFQAYVLQKRLTEAMRLLHHPEATVTDVCFSVGFSDLSYFARAFQRYVGKCPSQYRQSIPKRQTGSRLQRPRGSGEPQQPSYAPSPVAPGPDVSRVCEASPGKPSRYLSPC